METFEEWWARTGRCIDPDTEDVPWFDKRKSLAESAFTAAREQSTNYVCDDDTFPRKVTFANGRVVVIRERVDDPGRFFLGVGRVDGEIYLDQHCTLCGHKPVRYVKTKGGFHKVCDLCAGVLEMAGLLVEPDRIYAQKATVDRKEST